jgi:hypothetical protein
MDKYKYKNIPLSNILKAGSVANPRFTGMTYQVTTYNNSMALPFGYTPNPGATAAYTEVTAVGSNPITIPSGAKYIRFTGIGGAGGTGGTGGTAYDSNVPAGKQYGFGGAGGAGGAGGRSYMNQTPISSGSVIVVNIGNRGNTGTRGNDDNTEDDRYYTKGNAGGIGNKGGETYITINGTQYALANGGIGGNGGDSGYVYDGPGGSNNFGNGDPGNIGADGNGNASTNGIWDLHSGDYGTVKAAGGHAEIIWLYD